MDNDSYYNKVDSDQDLNIRDAESKSRVKLGQARRDRRNKAKELKAALKQRLKSLDNTKDKRELKEQFRSALKDIDTGLDSNRSGAGSTVQDDGIDNVESSTDILPDAQALAGIEIIWADQTIEFIEAADLTDTYNDEAYWSLVLTVSSGSFDKTLAYDATADIFTTTGTAPDEVQTKYRMRLITQYTNGDGDDVSTGISAYGQYREVTTCINGYPRQRLTKVT